MNTMLTSRHISEKRRQRIKGTSLKAQMASLMKQQGMKRDHLAKKLKMLRRGRICRNSSTWILIQRLNRKNSSETSLN